MDESDDAQKLKILAKYNDSWSSFEQLVDEYTQKYQTEIKLVNKEK